MTIDNIISCSELNLALHSDVKPIIFDVRKPPAYNSDPSTLPTASWKQFDQVEIWANELPVENKQLQIVVYCVHGHEVSQNAAKVLDSLGFKAKYLEGGIAAWKEQNLEVVSD